MGLNLNLVNQDKEVSSYQVLSEGNQGHLNNSAEKKFNRQVYAAAHVCADPFADPGSDSPVAVDWETTLAFRRHLWDLGFGVAEAMDTAQRGMGFDWELSLELIEKSCAEAKTRPGSKIACGVGTDHLESGKTHALDQIIGAYAHQLEKVQNAGGEVILMASRHLCMAAKTPGDYLRVYQRVLENCDGRAIIHWLGDMFDPQLKGYWGSVQVEQAMNACLEMMHVNRQRIAGIKLSLLDKSQEIKMRSLLPDGIRMFTGDDYHYPELIAGDDSGNSDALLGIFDAIAPVASLALNELGKGNKGRYFELMNPTVPLARLIFMSPTRFYKTGIVFLAYLNDFQRHFVMVGNQQNARGIAHFCQIFKEADRVGLLRDPEIAVRRMKALLKTYGVE